MEQMFSEFPSFLLVSSHKNALFFPIIRTTMKKLISCYRYIFPKIGLHKAFSFSNLYKGFVLDRREDSNHTDHISVMSKDSVIFLVCFYNSFCRGICCKKKMSSLLEPAWKSIMSNSGFGTLYS